MRSRNCSSDSRGAAAARADEMVWAGRGKGVSEKKFGDRAAWAVLRGLCSKASGARTVRKGCLSRVSQTLLAQTGAEGKAWCNRPGTGGCRCLQGAGRDRRQKGTCSGDCQGSIGNGRMNGCMGRPGRRADRSGQSNGAASPRGPGLRTKPCAAAPRNGVGE